MSSLMITVAIVGGITLLVFIAYIGQLAENNRRKKARLKADLAERYRRIADLNEQLAGQLMTPELKLLLSQLQLHFAERLLEVDKQDAAFNVAAGELRKAIALGESIAVRNPPFHITDDAKAKQVRHQLETLHGQLTRAAQSGLLKAEQTKHWTLELRHLMAQIYIELFGNQARHALQQKQLGHARLALERGVQFLQKQADTARYQTTLVQFQKQLERVTHLLLNTPPAGEEEPSELTAGLNTLDDDWKKKAIYD